ncbi:MAG: GNAT family N-acetyltransferase, partial [Alphaproteobacteria bacterium]
FGKDAAALYRDGKMMGHIYAAPYAALAPETCFVAESKSESKSEKRPANGGQTPHRTRIVGFAVGTTDTKAFSAQMEALWWPDLRARYAKPDPDQSARWNWDQKRAFQIHHPQTTPPRIVAAYPAHVHLNVLPEAHRSGVGSALLDMWLSRIAEMSCPKYPVRGVHAGVNARNTNAVPFWRAQGFAPLDDPAEGQHSSPRWLGRKLA